MIIVKENTVRFLERFGKLKRVLKPGINFFIPIADSVTSVISLKEQISDVEHQKVITKDNVEIDVDGNFFYRVNDPEKAYYNAQNYSQAIQGLSTSVSRSEIGKVTLDQIFQNRKELNDRIKQAINESTVNWGLECLSYEILKIEPPLKIKEALREVAAAERLRRKEIIISEAEREYNEKVSKAHREAQIIVQEAQYDGECMVNNKLGIALSQLSNAMAKFEQSKAVLDFIILESYIEQLKAILKNNKVFVFPEASSGGDSILLISTLLNTLKDNLKAEVNLQPLTNLSTKAVGLSDASKVEPSSADSKPPAIDAVLANSLQSAQTKASTLFES